MNNSTPPKESEIRKLERTYTQAEVDMRSEIHTAIFNEAVNQRDNALTELSELREAIKWYDDCEEFVGGMGMKQFCEFILKVETEPYSGWKQTDKHHAQILLNTIKGGE